MLSILDYQTDHRAVELLDNLKSTLTKKASDPNPTLQRDQLETLESNHRHWHNDIHVPTNTNMTPAEIDTAVHDVTAHRRGDPTKNNRQQPFAFYHTR